MRVRRADEDMRFGNAAPLVDATSDDFDRFAADEQGVDADDGGPRRAVVPHRGADLTGVVEFRVVRLAVTAGLLHADLGVTSRSAKPTLSKAGAAGWAAGCRRFGGAGGCGPQDGRTGNGDDRQSERTTQIVILRIRDALDENEDSATRKGEASAAGPAFCPMFSDFSSENAEIRCGPQLDIGRFLPMILYLNDPPPLVAEEESSDGQSRPS